MPAAALADRGLKRHYKDPEPCKILHRGPLGNGKDQPDQSDQTDRTDPLQPAQSSRTLWVFLAGALTATVTAGVWLFIRSSSR